VQFAKERDVIAWIVDSSQAKGVFTQEIHEFIGSDIFPAFKKIGVKYFITINSQQSALTNLTVSQYSSKAGPFGLELVEVPSVEKAIEWLNFKK
ncbi:MAG: hypothetical protein HQL29_05005, partial [Candidatus Omnitrophica bacterium]|nr:hypothetical protein [Candidatus Omnitrophota bacterium]